MVPPMMDRATRWLVVLVAFIAATVAMVAIVPPTRAAAQLAPEQAVAAGSTVLLPWRRVVCSTAGRPPTPGGSMPRAGGSR